MIRRLISAGMWFDVALLTVASLLCYAFWSLIFCLLEPSCKPFSLILASLNPPAF